MSYFTHYKSLTLKEPLVVIVSEQHSYITIPFVLHWATANQLTFWITVMISFFFSQTFPFSEDSPNPKHHTYTHCAKQKVWGIPSHVLDGWSQNRLSGSVHPPIPLLSPQHWWGVSLPLLWTCVISAGRNLLLRPLTPAGLGTHSVVRLDETKTNELKRSF